MNFKSFLGNNKIKEQISSLLDSNRLPHAIILEGDEGIGKVTFAKEIALAVVCREAEKPCYKCSQCRKVIEGFHPDVFEYSADGGVNSFHVETVRKIINDVYMSPNEANNKIYILGNCQSMSKSAQNALLKILEEPPKYVIFILTVDNRSNLLSTVLSRSVVITLSEVDFKTGADYIVEKNSEISFETAFSAISAFNGNIGKATQSILDGKVAKSIEKAVNICYALLGDDEFSLLAQCAEFEKNKSLIVSTMTVLTSIFRDAIVNKDTNAKLMSGQDEVVSKLSNSLSKGKLIDLIETTEQLKQETNMNANNALIITKICYSLRRAIGR